MPFDHVRCPSCNTDLDPESLVATRGQAPHCPRCGAALGLADLLGTASAFVDEDEPEMTLDDLVPGSGGPKKPAPGGGRSVFDDDPNPAGRRKLLK